MYKYSLTGNYNGGAMMLWDADNERDERKQAFIARMRKLKCRDILDQLSERLLAYDQEEIEPDEVFRTAAWAGRKGETLIGDFKKRPDVILAGIAMDEDRYLTGIGETGVSVRQAGVTEVFSDAIVIPAVADGSMTSGSALMVREEGGASIEEELRDNLPLGEQVAVATGPGDLTAAKIIHVLPPGGATPRGITEGVAAALSLADELGCETLAIPGFHIEGGDADRAAAAAAVLEALRPFEGETVRKVLLCDPDEEIVAAWVGLLEQIDEE